MVSAGHSLTEGMLMSLRRHIESEMQNALIPSNKLSDSAVRIRMRTALSDSLLLGIRAFCISDSMWRLSDMSIPSVKLWPALTMIP